MVIELGDASGGGSAVYTITADTNQNGFANVSSVAYEDGAPTEPDSWELKDPLGADKSSILSTPGAGVAEFDPNLYGFWTLAANFGGTIITRAITINYLNDNIQQTDSQVFSNVTEV